MQFSPEQLCAINEDNSEILVSAAAGSGKTSVLVERILRLITQKGISIDRMLVVTFTRAAAAEMCERLEKRLNDEAQRNPALIKQSELVSNAQISTIHGYCQKVVREHFEFCDVDPLFGICDAPTRERIFRECLDETLNEIYSRAEEDGDLLELINKFEERQLVEMLPPLYAFLMSRPDSMEWLERNTDSDWTQESFCESPAASIILNEVRLRIDAAIELCRKTLARQNEPYFPAPYVRTLTADLQLLCGFKESAERGLKDFYSALAALKFPVIARFKPQDDNEEALMDEVKDARDEYKALVLKMRTELPDSLEQSLADMNLMVGASRGLYKLMDTFHRMFTERKRERSIVDFNDLEHLTLKVIKSEQLRELERRRFDAVFVDEYQDVSAMQEEILNGLKGSEDSPRFYFYVGDVKQSIYRFRLAEPTLFLTKQLDFPTEAGHAQRLITLNRNFRSRPEVLAGVNRVFERVMDSRVTEIDYDEAARLVPGAQEPIDESVDEAGAAMETHLLECEGILTSQRPIAEATFIAKDILARIGAPITDSNGAVCGTLHYRDIAILSPVSQGVADKVELTLRSFGIPVYCENGSDSLTSDEVEQVVGHLHLLDNLMDDTALISELRSPLFDMTESELSRIRISKPEKQASFLEALRHSAEQGVDAKLKARCAQALAMLARERELAGSMPLDEYLWDFIQRSGLYAHYGAQPGGRQRQANLRLLCSLASSYEQNGTGGLNGFLSTVKGDLSVSSGFSPTVVNPWEDVVRLMTIHKSKGLEFPVVYVMGMGRSLQGKNKAGRVRYHQNIGLSLTYVNEHARTQRGTLLQTAIDLAKKSEERAERARLLYVAMTRAKRRLVLVGSRKLGDFGYENALDIKNGVLDAGGLYSVKNAGSMLDWVSQCIKPWDRVEAADIPPECGIMKQNDMENEGLSMGYPQFDVVFRYVFHIAPEIAGFAKRKGKLKLDFPLVPINVPDRDNVNNSNTAYVEKQFYTPVEREHKPLKLGVTALCRMLGENGITVDSVFDGDEDEPIEVKRLPFQAERPKLLAALPSEPEFLHPTEKAKPLIRGTATHKLLGLVSLEGARSRSDKEMRAFVISEKNRLAECGMLDEDEARAADIGLVTGFLCGGLGRRMLASDIVKREWRFNLMISDPTVAQGVIDLCFLEDGKWVLADFKTDRVTDEAELYERYASQLELYRLALAKLTRCPVKESLLHSLTLGRAVNGSIE